jgi:isocitrate dehydrogenase (NAD+)
MRKVTLIPGDGVGPELSDAMRRCVDATGAGIEWEVMDAGEGVMKKEGTPLPEAVLNSIRKNRIAIKGPITTPIGTGFRSVNVALRKELNLYACLRPCRLYTGIKSAFKSIDLVIIRENSEDLYSGIEFFEGTPECKSVIKSIEDLSKKKINPDSAISIKPISISASKAIFKYAFEYALSHGRKKVTAVHKANIMKATDGLFLKAGQEVAQEYAGRVEFNDRIVDNMCMQLVQRPNDYDMLVLPNLYGDILSDLCAGLIGGLGVAPGANIGHDIAVFEATHGSAPKYAGQNKMNPTALILSAVLMLKHMNEPKKADLLDQAVSEILAENKDVTYDLKAAGKNDPTAVGTREMGDAIVARIKSLIRK